MGLAFALKYKDTVLDLVDDTVLTVEWYSTLFNENEVFRGSYSYAVDLKLSDKNKALLGMPHLLENRLSRQKIEVSVWLYGHTWKNATYDYEVLSDRLSGNLLIDNAIIADWLRDTSLPDVFSYYDGTKISYHSIDIGSNVTERTAYLNHTATSGPGVYPMAFPGLYNYGWDGQYKRWGNIPGVNVYFSETENSFKILNLNLFFCPMFYLTWLIKEVCSKMGFEAVGTFMEHPEVKRWIIYNTSYYTGVEMNQSEFVIIPSRHLPKITIGSLFKILRNDLKLGIYFDSLTKIAHFNLPNTILETIESIDLSVNQVRNSLKIKDSIPKKLKVKTAKDDSDNTYQYIDTIDSMTLGKGSSEPPVELSIDAPIMHRPMSQSGVNFYRWPMVEQIVNLYDNYYADTDMYNKTGEISKNTFSFRLLSYRGLESYDSSNLARKTSYATSDNRNGLGGIDPAIISTDPGNTGSWLRKLCEPFYRMLHISEQIEVDTYVGIDSFSKLSPLTKSIIRSRSGAKLSVLLDRVTFEPKKSNGYIFAKLKGYTVNKAYALLGNTEFQVADRTIKDSLVYLSAWFEDFRTVTDSTSATTYAKVRINFYGDKYCQEPALVSGLTVHLLITDNFYTNTIVVNTTLKDVTVTTGTNVSTHLTSTEYRISYQTSGNPESNWKADIEPIVLEGDTYIPVL